MEQGRIAGSPICGSVMDIHLRQVIGRMIRKATTLLLLSAALICAGFAQKTDEIFVAPNGTPNGAGSMSNPMDLGTALRGDHVQPGMTVWLLEGTYSGVFTSKLTGTSNSPIVVRAYPGARAIISDDRSTGKGGTLNIFGAWTTYRDFEVTNRSPERGMFHQFRPMGLEVQAPHTKFINLIIHDTGHGFGFWKEAVDSEIYGCIIFNGGTQNSEGELRYGHGIYTQNNEGTKQIRDNIIFNQFGWGIHGYPNPGDLTGFDIEGNIIFNNGSNSNRSYRFPSIMVGGYKPHGAARITVANNYTYESQEQRPLKKFSDTNLCLGCSDPNDNQDATVRDNYLVGGIPVAEIANFRQITLTGNFLYGQDGMAVVLLPKGASARDYRWDNNRYYGPGVEGTKAIFALDNKAYDFNQWRETTGFDRSSQYSPTRPGGVDVFVRPNQYDPGRGHVVVYNWDRRNAVDVNLGNVLRTGQAYEVYNVADLFGSPVASGQYQGGSIRLPMGPVRVARALGKSEAPSDTGPEFNAFLVLTVKGQPRTTQQMPTGSLQESTPQPGQGQQGSVSDYSKYAGTFQSRNARIVVSLEGDQLNARFMHEKGEPSYQLKNAGGDRFQIVGAPSGFYIEFDSGAQSLKVIRGILPPVNLSRVK
jgi:Right handed beta helix region